MSGRGCGPGGGTVQWRGVGVAGCCGSAGGESLRWMWWCFFVMKIGVMVVVVVVVMVMCVGGVWGGRGEGDGILMVACSP